MLRPQFPRLPLSCTINELDAISSNRGYRGSNDTPEAGGQAMVGGAFRLWTKLLGACNAFDDAWVGLDIDRSDILHAAFDL